MTLFVMISLIAIGLVLFIHTMSKISNSNAELNSLLRKSGLLKKSYKKVEIDSLSIVINNHLNPVFETLPDFEKDNIIENLGISVIYSYIIDDVEYVSTTVSILNSLENIEHLEALAKKEKKYCYVTGKNNKISFLVKPDRELIDKEKKKKTIKELPKLGLSVAMLAFGLVMMVI